MPGPGLGASHTPLHVTFRVAHEANVTTLITPRVRKQTVADIWYLALGHTACKQYRQNLNPGLSSSLRCVR